MKRITYLAIALFVSISAMADNIATDLGSWMGKIKDSAPLCRLTIPGTHDSGASSGSTFVKCQSTNIQQQLKDGIRAFDIRLRASGSRLEVCHGSSGLGTYFNSDVMEVMASFLKTHPTETIIMSLKCDDGSEADYTSNLTTVMNSYAEWFVTDFSPNIKLGEARGKIVCLHRNNPPQNYSGARLTGFQDNNKQFVGNISTASGVSGTYSCEDYYTLANSLFSAWDKSGKLEAIKKNMSDAANENETSTQWYITFTSGTAPLALTDPAQVANGIGPSLNSWLYTIGDGGYGIVFSDFVGSSKTSGPDNTKVLINKNSNLQPDFEYVGLPNGIKESTINDIENGKANWYRIKAVNAQNRCMKLYNREQEETSIALSDASAFDDTQLWAFVKTAEDKYRIYNYASSTTTNLCYAEGEEDGAIPTMGSLDDDWFFVNNGKSIVRISQTDNNELYTYLNAYGGETASEVRYYQADNGSSWTIEDAYTNGAPILPYGMIASTEADIASGTAHWYKIFSNKFADKYITNDNSSELKLESSNNESNNQLWCVIKDASTNKFCLINYENIDSKLSHNATTDGSSPTWNEEGDDWYFTTFADGTFYISASKTNEGFCFLNSYGGDQASQVKFYSADEGSMWKCETTIPVLTNICSELFSNENVTINGKQVTIEASKAKPSLYGIDGKQIPLVREGSNYKANVGKNGIYILKNGESRTKLNIL